MLKVTELTMDYLRNPVGVAGMPRFSWKLESDRRNVLQEGYRLQVARTPDFRAPVYDSGFVESGRSVHVEVTEDRFLCSLSRYYARVQVRAGGCESAFCVPGSFVTGILKEREWKARFVSGESREDRERSGSTCLRRDILLSGEVEEAYVCATALGLYQLYINGEKVGEDELTPGWTSYHRHLCYQTYDVAEMLTPGGNTLAAMVGAGWYKGKMGFLLRRNNYGERTAFFLQMKVRYTDGREEWFATDGDWEAADGPVLFSEIYDGEVYDATRELPGWKVFGGGSSRTVQDGGETAQGAGEPAQDGSEMAKGIAGAAQEASAPAAAHIWRPVESVEFPLQALTAQPGCRVGIMDRLPVRRIFTTPKGECVLDFGQNLTGWVECVFRGNPGDEAVLKCFEVLDREGNVYTENLRSAKQELRYICRGGEEVWHPHFTFQGFRYVQVISLPGEARAEDFTALTVHSRMERTGEFRCSDPLVNQLQHNILWGLKGNFVDIPMDCPQRDERVGWTGDAQIFCRTACFLMQTYPFYEKWLKDVAADQTEEGGVPHVVPDIISGREENDWLLSQGTHSAAAWADAAVINPWTMYLVYGDRKILADQYDSMKKWIGFMEAHSRDYIWNYRLQFGDWVALDAREGSYFGATPNDLTCTAYFAYSTGLFAKIAGILGQEADAAYYGGLQDRIVEKFRNTFFDGEGRMTAQTQTAHIVALYFDLVPEGYRMQTARRLVELLEEQRGHLVTGFVGTPYFCHALSDNGYVEEAYRLLLQEDFPSWLYQVKMGATTVWEHWDGLKPDGTMWSPDMNSFNHYAYGAVGDWLYRVVLGIQADEQAPGYRHSIISPRTGEAFDFAEGSYESVYGRLAVRWERQDGRIVLQVTVPPNTTADIRLEPEACEAEAEGLVFVRRDGRMTAECGSGSWEVRYAKYR